MTTVPAEPTDQLDPLASLGTPSEPSGLAPLTGFDRCDSPGCSAQAYLRAQLRSGLDLVFCGHHGHDLVPGLVGQGAIVRDDTHLLS
jgi:hypothetical protein